MFRAGRVVAELFFGLRITRFQFLATGNRAALSRCDCADPAFQWAAVEIGVAFRRVQTLYPAFPMFPPDWAVALALLVSVSVGLVFGVLPAWRASRLNPVAALSRR